MTATASTGMLISHGNDGVDHITQLLTDTEMLTQEIAVTVEEIEGLLLALLG